ncbi:unnamed protein product [Mytilus coruscus]|uniref:Uncharacterized protein n=1 Tax=Mytilus coruscus TaxID=42192 RepID=A0A6J8B2Y4_MYTCO|nr:unnamed protein product [Mytilus coruscus]
MNDSGIFESSLDNRKKKTAKIESLSADTIGVEALASSRDGEFVSTEGREQVSVTNNQNGSSIDNVLSLSLNDKNNVKCSNINESKPSDLTERDLNKKVLDFSNARSSQTKCEKLEHTEHLHANNQLDSSIKTQMSAESLAKQQHNFPTNGQQSAADFTQHSKSQQLSHQNLRDQSHPNREPSYPLKDHLDGPRQRRNQVARTPSFRLPTHNRQTMPEDIHILTQFFVTIVICAISLLSFFYELS